MANKTFEQIYRNAPAEYRDRLRTFRDAHPPKSITDPLSMRYIVGGNGKDTILFVSGVGTDAESHFMQLAELEKACKVISVTIPAAPTMKALTAGLAALLDAEKVDKAHLFGVSFGGLVIQSFLHDYPARAQNLILSHTMLPRSSAVEDHIKQHTATKSLPTFLYSMISRAAGMKLLNDDIPDVTADEKAFWKCYYVDLYPHTITKEIFLARLLAGADYQQNYDFTSGKPSSWDNPVLILESAKDSYISQPDRQALKEHYTGAVVHTDTTYGHMGALVRVDPTVRPILSFLGHG